MRKRVSINWGRWRREYKHENRVAKEIQKEFAESGDDVFQRLKSFDGLNAFQVDSSDDYLNEAAAFEWTGIPPNTPKAIPGRIYLTMTGKTGRLTVKINSVSRIVFEFRAAE